MAREAVAECRGVPCEAAALEIRMRLAVTVPGIVKALARRRVIPPVTSACGFDFAHRVTKILPEMPGMWVRRVCKVNPARFFPADGHQGRDAECDAGCWCDANRF